ncbi:hypothetical protein [Streptomyces lunaelactis]|uniref:hypothetical protein n=1 Tax=Streptomyces lunaelactis TaxID=1535768 RepID=UPI0015857766|nr:hypothetical protein [Streptomyces lunaelactis]NUL24928.1 hypothetical protein [Streptomyces lunaelactis]
MTDPFLAALDQATRTVIARARGELPVAASTAIAHSYCCDPNWALCGLDLADLPPSGHGEQDCVVCAELDQAQVNCPLCPSNRGAA